MDVKYFIEKKISEAVEERETLLKMLEEIEIKLGVYKEIAKEFQVEVEREIITQKIRGTTLPKEYRLLEEDDRKRVNIFLEYTEKCGKVLEAKVFREKMPKLNHYLYNKKSRLWNSWDEFSEDIQQWWSRTGRWENILVPEGNGRNN